MMSELWLIVCMKGYQFEVIHLLRFCAELQNNTHKVMEDCSFRHIHKERKHMCVCARMCDSIHIYTHTHIHVYIHTHKYKPACMHTYIHTYIHTQAQDNTCAFAPVHECVMAYIHIHSHVHRVSCIYKSNAHKYMIIV